MIQVGTMLLVADNSGVKKVKCIGMSRNSSRRGATVGDVITVSVRKATSRAKLSKRHVSKAVIVRVCAKIKRPEGFVLSFNHNAVVLLNNQHEPIGTRVFGSVYRELRPRFVKIVSLAKEVL